MQSVASFLRNYFPVRFHAGPLIRREMNHDRHIQTFHPFDLQDFLALKVRPREMLLAPILPERSQAMLYAPRGVGKSWLGLTSGLAVASGGRVLRWNAPRPRRVLFVDGEMVLCELQKRLNSLLAGLGTEVPDGGFRILAADHTERGINLGSTEGQQALERHLDDRDLLILDNLSTLLTSGSEGASDAWLPIQNWLLGLRRKGIAVLLVHHSGVNGRQRGTSRREDTLDTVIGLRRPDDYSPDEGARFEVRIEKARTLVGEGALPFEAFLESFVTTSGGSGSRGVAQDLKPSLNEQAARLFAEGRTVREVEKLLGISHGTAGRLRQRVQKDGGPDGMADDDPENEKHSLPN